MFSLISVAKDREKLNFDLWQAAALASAVDRTRCLLTGWMCLLLMDP